jgi:predicted house-cleaning noncanonical NTP pyrophosphatase (MazG superfamily)
MKSSQVSIADVRYRPKKIMNIIEIKNIRRHIMPTYNKLVRDRIPEIIEKEGKTYNSVILNDSQFKSELQKKLKEEVEEFLNAQSDQEAVEELADVLEIIHALAEAHNLSTDELEQVRKYKAKERGGFQEKIFLIEVED